jgi:hypothetical protein
MTAGGTCLRRISRIDLSCWCFGFKAVVQGSISKPFLSSTTLKIQVLYDEDITRIGFDELVGCFSGC